MATYEEIKREVEKDIKSCPKSCWIADVKEQCGLPVRKAWNRIGKGRTNPCPAGKIKPIRDALKKLGMI